MTYDAIIVGGSYAGLSAAMPLGRARKRVLIIDAEQRRNRFATAAHGFLGQDGRPPGDIVRDARAEVVAHPTVSFIDGSATAATPVDTGFAITLADGTMHAAARLILATGVVDELPALPGLREQWGTGVALCPYCHGYEVAGGRLGVLALLPMPAHHALLIREWGDVTFFPNGIADPDDAERAMLAANGVAIEEAEVAAITGEPGQSAGIQLRDGRTITLDAIFTGVPSRMASAIPAALGCAFDDSPSGPIIRVDATMQTTVPGVFAAGDAARAMSFIAGAVADGYLAGAAAHRSLVMAAHGL
ncbi:MAG: NAD(P)/FAD-dependent oxidoreductase [Chloroflexia bacterium]|nr:NAD(P)/FAD-dependent oxidoreductase [Chloroflexia bacterium]